jgi:hypothetical protein
VELNTLLIMRAVRAGRDPRADLALRKVEAGLLADMIAGDVAQGDAIRMAALFRRLRWNAGRGRLS